MHSTRQRYTEQKGAALLIASVFLLLLSLLAFSSHGAMLLQGKLIATTRDNLLAFHVAESALQEAESKVALSHYSIDGGASGLYDYSHCSHSEAKSTSCYLQHIDDEGWYNASIWQRSTQADTKVACGVEESCYLSGRYIIIDLGPMASDVRVATDEDDIQVIDARYGLAASAPAAVTHKYKIIALGKGLHPFSRQVLISYYRATRW